MAGDFWTFTGWGKEQHDRIVAAARAGQYAGALRLLEEFGVYAGIVSCFLLAETDRRAFGGLAAQAPNVPGLHWAHFYVRLVQEGGIPEGIPSMTAEFYHSARVVLLRARAEKTKLVHSLWGDGFKTNPGTKPFFPEMLRAYRHRRARVCAVAKAHADKGPHDPYQIALFSLGGLYDYNVADRGTSPPGTTCLLFARSVLHAAGWNVIDAGPLATQRFSCGCPNGTGELDNLYANQPRYYTRATAATMALGPQPGDVFHIQGPNYDSARYGKNIDSTHVGVVLSASKDTWMTVEGGRGDHVTRARVRRLVSAGTDQWAFEDDVDIPAVKHRPIRGWFDVSKLALNRWMPGA